MTQDRKRTEVRGHHGLSETRESTWQGEAQFLQASWWTGWRVRSWAEGPAGTCGEGEIWLEGCCGLLGFTQRSGQLILEQSTFQKACPDTPENHHLLPSPPTASPSASASASLSSRMASTVSAQGPGSASSPHLSSPFCLSVSLLSLSPFFLSPLPSSLCPSAPYLLLLPRTGPEFLLPLFLAQGSMKPVNERISGEDSSLPEESLSDLGRAGGGRELTPFPQLLAALLQDLWSQISQA